MNFKVDENLPLEFVDLLREAGHDAVSVLDQQLGGADDPTVAARCRQEQRVVITLVLYQRSFAEQRRPRRGSPTTTDLNAMGRARSLNAPLRLSLPSAHRCVATLTTQVIPINFGR